MEDEEEDPYMALETEAQHFCRNPHKCCDTETGEGMYGYPGCGLRGWVLSPWDSWEKCSKHYHGQRHPEDDGIEEEVPVICHFSKNEDLGF